MLLRDELMRVSSIAGDLLGEIQNCHWLVDQYRANDWYRDRVVESFYKVDDLATSYEGEFHRCDEVGECFASVNENPIVVAGGCLPPMPSAHVAACEYGLGIRNVGFEVVKAAMPERVFPGAEYVLPRLPRELPDWLDMGVPAFRELLPLQAAYDLAARRPQELARAMEAATGEVSPDDDGKKPRYKPPKCKKCGVQMYTTSSPPGIRHLKCENPACGHTSKVRR